MSIAELVHKDPAYLANVSDYVVATTAYDHDVMIADVEETLTRDIARLREKHEAEHGWMYATRDALRAEIAKRIERDGGKAMPHQTLRIEFVQKTKRVVLKDVAEQLLGMLPESETKKAVRWETPEPKPELKTHITHLETLAKKFGGEVAEIVREAIVEQELGPKVLVIEPRPSEMKTVGPKSLGEAA